MKTGLKNVLLPTLFTIIWILLNIVTPDSGSTILFNIVTSVNNVGSETLFNPEENEDNGLWKFLQSKVSYCLHMYFLWRHHLSPNKSENGQDSDSDWFTYCIDIIIICLLTLLFSLQYFSESWIGNDNNFLLPNPFLFGATPRQRVWARERSRTTTTWLTIFACLAHCVAHSEFRVRNEDRLEIHVKLFVNADSNPYPAWSG
jgi:hypothetical protein